MAVLGGDLRLQLANLLIELDKGLQFRWLGQFEVFHLENIQELPATRIEMPGRAKAQRPLAEGLSTSWL
ncbi:MAG: hypothetical protein P4L70_10040 [Parasulfuritortus sp.]|nr:hypothetical protein [Parasulfuritortus sp.]